LYFAFVNDANDSHVVRASIGASTKVLAKDILDREKANSGGLIHDTKRELAVRGRSQRIRGREHSGPAVAK